MSKIVPNFYRISLTLTLCTAILGSSCKKPVKTAFQPLEEDPHSSANLKEAIVTHLNLQLQVDFTQKQLSGTATWQIKKHPDCQKLRLDVKGLVIRSVKSGDKEISNWTLKDTLPLLGSYLEIPLESNTHEVSITYHTTEKAEALQWLAPAQTGNGKLPILYTQSQAILCRTWIPCMDAPAVKFTYEANISTPDSLIALMSAAGNTVERSGTSFRFNMPQPVPAYLMALAVGPFQYKSLGDSCGVYAEPGMLQQAAAEFVDLPEMIKAAETLYGPYAWGRYDLLVMPPSFPFGGMENPRLTFVTPTIITGDKSLVSLVAHELAHSWSGNLVTNASWNDFWLNEGFTVYFEKRIMEQLYGKDAAEVHSYLGHDLLLQTLEDMGADNPDTRLALDIKGRNPDLAVTDIAYEKGRFFLETLERLVGRTALDGFLNAYFKKHAFQTISTPVFLEELRMHFAHDSEKLEKEFGLNAWIFETGLPKNLQVAYPQQFKEVDTLIYELKASSYNMELEVMPQFTTQQWLHLIRSLRKTINLEEQKKLDHIFNFTQNPNAEIALEWLLICIRNDYKEAFPTLESFLLSNGRRKFVAPLFEALQANSAHKAWAEKVYEKAAPGYHEVTNHTIRALFNGGSYF